MPEPMTADAANRPRDPSGRVLAPIRIEVKFIRARGGYRRYVDTWPEAASFLTSADFDRTATIVKSVTLTAVNPDAGPPLAVPSPSYDRGQAA